MTRRDFDLENGIYCRGLYDDFKLYYEDVAVTPVCSAIAYVPNKLIAVKSSNIVIVYAPEILEIEEEYVLPKIACFKHYKGNAYLKVKLGENTYIIDSNVQITLCSCRKFY